MEHDALVAESDPEVLQAPVSATGLGQRVVELIAEDGGGVAAGGPDSGFAAPSVVIVVEHPPVHDRVAQLHDASRDGVLLDVVALAVDASELPGLAAVVALADEHLDVLGELPEAAVEVAGDPVPARFGDARGGLGGVVAFVLAEQHDLSSMSLAAQQPRLVVLLELAPEVAVSVGPWLWL